MDFPLNVGTMFHINDSFEVLDSAEISHGDPSFKNERYLLPKVRRRYECTNGGLNLIIKEIKGTRQYHTSRDHPAFRRCSPLYHRRLFTEARADPHTTKPLWKTCKRQLRVSITLFEREATRRLLFFMAEAVDRGRGMNIKQSISGLEYSYHDICKGYASFSIFVGKILYVS